VPEAFGLAIAQDLLAHSRLVIRSPGTV